MFMIWFETALQEKKKKKCSNTLKWQRQPFLSPPIRISICWTITWPQPDYSRSSLQRAVNPSICQTIWFWRYKINIHLLTPFLDSFPTSVTLCFFPSPHCVLQITFLEFFEVLLGSAEVKCPQVSEGLEEGRPLSSPDTEAGRDLPEVEATNRVWSLSQTSSPLTHSMFTPVSSVWKVLSRDEENHI